MTNVIQWSDKVGDQILVIGGADPAEFETNMYSILGQSVADKIIDSFATKHQPPSGEHAAAVRNLSEGGMAPASVYPQQQTQGPPAYVPQAPAGVQAPRCQHGQKVWREDRRNTPPEWRAWACPADRNDPTRCRLDYV